MHNRIIIHFARHSPEVNNTSLEVFESEIWHDVYIVRFEQSMMVCYL